MRPSGGLFATLRRGVFPHQLAWLLNNPLRHVLLSPVTLADRLPLARDSHVLEVGPGSGFFSRELARRVPDGLLHLVDVQPEMLKKAERGFGVPRPSNLACTVADAAQPLPFAPASIDIVLLIAVLGELSDRTAALGAFRHVLRPGGTLAVHEHRPDPDFIERGDLVRLIEKSGFSFVSSMGPGWNDTALFKIRSPRRPVRSGISPER